MTESYLWLRMTQKAPMQLVAFFLRLGLLKVSYSGINFISSSFLTKSSFLSRRMQNLLKISVKMSRHSSRTSSPCDYPKP
jgi:hypothetical protein